MLKSALPIVFTACLAHHALALTVTNFVSPKSDTGSFELFANGKAPVIFVDSNDWPGVVRVAGDLKADIHRVSGANATLTRNPSELGRQAILIGTIGRSAMIDRLVREKKIDVSDVAGKWESFLIQVVPKPFSGVDSALVIAGSDKRGTIYGVYEVSEQIGVSPWYFWADSPPKQHDQLYVKAGRFVQGPPSVKYRGFFINDEAPALTEWVRATYGNVPGRSGTANYGRGFYTNMFELMLRVRANYLWPAMWSNAFNEDDPENPRLADEYGIVMGTSHQEPMLRAQQEWDRGPRRQYGLWDYNKTEQRPALQQFWREGIRRNKDFESIITMGLRAENDSGEPVGKEMTEEIIGVQRKILAEEMNPDLTQIPQMWCLYKEVMAYYEDGLRVPDDITLLWAEDNWGNVRRLPTAAERNRSGGAGVYYHFDYHGGPRSYQWINTSPIQKVWEQMSLAKQYGADRIWIVNIGHFNKSGEFAMEFFTRFAWDTSRWTHENLDEYTRLWAEREFGSEHAAEIADIITTYSKYNGRRKPELLEPRSYSLLNYREFEDYVADYRALAARAEKINAQLPPRYRDAYYTMVLFPTKACAELNAMYLAAAKNALYAQQRRASANDWAEQTRSLFQLQTNLLHHYNRVFSGGKWNHFMDQTYIGYTSWNPPRSNSLNAIKLTEIEVPEAAAMGVAVEGSTEMTGGKLAFDKFGQASRYIDVFNQGKTPFTFSAKPSAPWIRLSETGGKVEKDRRIEVSVDWSKAPGGNSSGEINVSGADTNLVVAVAAFNPSEPKPGSFTGFVEADGFVSMEAGHFTRKTDAGANRWILIPDYGRTLSGLRSDGPPEVLATPGKDSPSLEYQMYLFNSGEVEIELITGPTLSFMPNRPLRLAVSVGDETPKEVTIVPAVFEGYYTNPVWSESVKNSCHRIKFKHTIQQPGPQTLKIWMVDPGIVLTKIVVNTGGVKPSYLGPPESARLGN
ncbi:MAG TPA: glycosyl hydrolase 115 family protein [Verrucomicrobiota bacterium]|nr:glycosyl hydrolase 115 family protein [Verrucomicrobiota bacterium]